MSGTRQGTSAHQSVPSMWLEFETSSFAFATSHGHRQVAPLKGVFENHMLLSCLLLRASSSAARLHIF